MKILLFSDPSSAHTIKWANGLAERGVEVIVFGFSSFDKKNYLENILVISSPLISDETKAEPSGSLKKVSYFRLMPELKRILAKEKPDILHAHYGSSYGLIGAFSGFHPYIVSYWGSDLFVFAKKNFVNRYITKLVCSKSNVITVTSDYLAEELKKYSSKTPFIIPFGIDLNKFLFKQRSIDDAETIVIGIVKLFKDIYGIKILLNAFDIVLKKYKTKKVKLLLVGDGEKRSEYEQIVAKYGISNSVEFAGLVQPKDIMEYYDKIDLAVFPSYDESFGVALIEAMACGIPVIASNIPAFKEIFKDGDVGDLILSHDKEAFAERIIYYLENAYYYKRKHSQTRVHVEKYYSLHENISKMKKVYETTMMGK
ncbi:MAG: glycosyltransferase [Ignavibacteria bacterium]|nr:glycosyltransferase [Ignavibacteria bacterium]